VINSKLKGGILWEEDRDRVRVVGHQSKTVVAAVLGIESHE